MRCQITRHAIRRYRERVNPHGGPGLCRELVARLADAELVEPPAWASRGHRKGDTYALLDAETVVVLRGRVAVTVLTRQTADELVRRECTRLGWVKAA